MKKQSAADWASTNESKNMTLAEADHFRDQLAQTLILQFGNRYVKTSANEMISESELRHNTFISPLPVNLFGTIANSTADVNIAEFRTALRNAAASDDPTYEFLKLLQSILPGSVTGSYLSRLPAVQQVIQDALGAF
jgi:hypothetical protein